MNLARVRRGAEVSGVADSTRDRPTGAVSAIDRQRAAGLLASGVAFVSILGCGSADDGATPLATVGEPERQVFTTEAGLECPQDLFVFTEYEAGMAEPGAGFVDIGTAAADFWSSGEGRFRRDRIRLTEIVDPPVVRYDNDRGETQLILSFVQIDDRWLLDQGEACSYAPVGPPGRALDVRDEAGAVASARFLVPEEVPSYESIRLELEERRAVVMQPGEIGFDVLIVYRSTPQCGNLPEVVVDGDRSALSVTVETPISGDCDDVEYDRAIALDLVPDFEPASIAVD